MDRMKERAFIRCLGFGRIRRFSDKYVLSSKHYYSPKRKNGDPENNRDQTHCCPQTGALTLHIGFCRLGSPPAHIGPTKQKSPPHRLAPIDESSLCIGFHRAEGSTRALAMTRQPDRVMGFLL